MSLFSKPVASRLAITPGEPAGIGPELAVQLIQQDWAAALVWMADPDLLRACAARLSLPIDIQLFNAQQPPVASRAGQAVVIPVGLKTPVIPGQLNIKNADYVLETLRMATFACQDGTVDALVTGPVHKGVINDAGITFSGHTEFLAELTGAWPVMLLVADTLRVALVTTHLPLKEVPAAITAPHLLRLIRVLHKDLRNHFSLADPKILVCGLNPHAGENGHMGREEIEIITPVLQQLRAEGMNLIGPLPADTLFVPNKLADADAVLAMYHDQGLPVLKHVGFGNAVNVTLGLPIIRTSVDHGVALDLVGTGEADRGSFEAAIKLACQLAKND